ncbi:MAG: S41 family peptidase [bacterium]
MNKKLVRFVLKFSIFFVSLVIFFIGGFLIGRMNLLNRIGERAINYSVTGDIKTQYYNIDLKMLWKVWDTVETQYINKNVNGKDLYYGAIKGLVSGLNDPYTNYLNPDETQEYLKSNAGEFEGIGATLKQDGDLVLVESPLDGSPAQKAGILAGDVILKVNNEDMQSQSVYNVAAKIRGPKDTDVTIVIYRPSQSKQLELTITRQKIDMNNVVYQGTKDGIAEIKIYKFTEESLEKFNTEWDTAVEQALKDNNGTKGIIIDLRNNPGGYVKSVEYVLGEFLPKNTVIYQEEDRDGNKIKYKVTRTGKFLDIPLLVLVNEGSASASEIFSAAIQDNHRGKVVGMPTVGKGVEQKPIVFDDGSMLQLVFQKWLTPDGRNISKTDPITPDEKVEEYEQQDIKAREMLK